VYLLVDVQVTLVCTQFRILSPFLLCDRQHCTLCMDKGEFRSRISPGAGDSASDRVGDKGIAWVRVPLRQPEHGTGPSPMVNGVRHPKGNLAGHGKTQEHSQGPDPHLVSSSSFFVTYLS